MAFMLHFLLDCDLNFKSQAEAISQRDIPKAEC